MIEMMVHYAHLRELPYDELLEEYAKACNKFGHVRPDDDDADTEGMVVNINRIKDVIVARTMEMNGWKQGEYVGLYADWVKGD